MTYYRRHLPHWQPQGQDVFLTWRLHDSLPKNVQTPPNLESDGKTFVAYDRVLDQARTGPLWLKDARIAKCIFSTICAAQQQRMFTLRAYVLMANHVHMLRAPRSPIGQITQQLKGASAREANLILGRTWSRFWQNESFDHWIRGPGEWERVRSYIERNPVTAGLVSKPEEWPWSSASHPIEAK